uniref:Uncharacterized protein n=1 Tax=Rangifer tarandus platyrhynchus TaxID=3082113 RepID=A0ACB0F6Y5_RANTA|nr:unnamed protein product [Rangifer tarandus platyrhynchus]
MGLAEQLACTSLTAFSCFTSAGVKRQKLLWGKCRKHFGPIFLPKLLVQSQELAVAHPTVQDSIPLNVYKPRWLSRRSPSCVTRFQEWKSTYSLQQGRAGLRTMRGAAALHARFRSSAQSRSPFARGRGGGGVCLQ